MKTLHPNNQLVNLKTLGEKLTDIDLEFKDVLASLIYQEGIGHEKLKTFSPLDEVAHFELRGIQAVPEVKRDEMLANDEGFSKLLANMLNQCRPGALSDEDYTQISGINGREIHADF